MSHFSEVKTHLKNGEILKKALCKLGYALVEGDEGVEVRGFQGATLPADFKILTKTHYDIGFRKNAEGNYEFVGDWELLPKVSGIERDALTAEVKKAYAQIGITELAKASGYDVTSEVDSETGTIEMVVTQW